MVIRSGKLRHKVQVQRNSGEGTYGDHGEVTDNWVKDFDWWCEIITLSGDEGAVARQNFPNATHQLKGRYDSRLENTRHRVAHGSRTYHIEHIDNVEQRNIEMVLTVGEEKGEAP